MDKFITVTEIEKMIQNYADVCEDLFSRRESEDMKKNYAIEKLFACRGERRDKFFKSSEEGCFLCLEYIDGTLCYNLCYTDNSIIHIGDELLDTILEEFPINEDSEFVRMNVKASIALEGMIARMEIRKTSEYERLTQTSNFLRKRY